MIYFNLHVRYKFQSGKKMWIYFFRGNGSSFSGVVALYITRILTHLQRVSHMCDTQKNKHCWITDRTLIPSQATADALADSGPAPHADFKAAQKQLF